MNSGMDFCKRVPYSLPNIKGAVQSFLHVFKSGQTMTAVEGSGL